MSVYVVKRKDQGPDEFICSMPTFDLAVEVYRELEMSDRSLGDYQPERYGIVEREYCPVNEFNCEHYMLGICSLRYPVNCKKYLEAELAENTIAKSSI